MNRPMTAAQAAQQNNRHTDGRYAEGQLADPGQILGELQAVNGRHPDLHLWEGIDIPMPHSEQEFVDGTRVRTGDFDTCYSDFMEPLDDWETAHGQDYRPQLDQDELFRYAGFDPFRKDFILSNMTLTATRDGIRVEGHSQMAGTDYVSPPKVDGYWAALELDEKAALRDKIRSGQLPPWAILTPNPDTELQFEVQEQVLAGDMQMYSRRANDWDAAITAGEQVLAEATYKPAKTVGYYSDKYLDASNVKHNAHDYRHGETCLVEARKKKATAAAEIADFDAVAADNPPYLTDVVKAALAKGRKHSEYDLERAESEERAAYKQMREALAHLTRRLPLATQARSENRKLAVDAENALADLETRKAWELSWPGHHTQVPAKPGE